MTLDQFRKQAHQGHCTSCNRTTLVMGWQNAIHTRPGEVIDLCFVCSNIPSACAQHNDYNRGALGAISLLLDVLKPPKKPRQPKTEGPAVHPMRPRKR